MNIVREMRLRWSRRLAGVILTAAVLSLSGAAIGVAQGASKAGEKSADAGQSREWIAQMKDSARGPFARIRWFCKDGRVLPPRDYACAKKGEGWQHGEWSEHTKQLRAQGYAIANVLAGIDAKAAVADPEFPDRYAQLLVEKFLIATDDGWIFRKARFYRGGIQEEDEREAARALLTALAARDDWIGWRYPALRAGVRLLPHGRDTARGGLGIGLAVTRGLVEAMGGSVTAGPSPLGGLSITLALPTVSVPAAAAGEGGP